MPKSHVFRIIRSGEVRINRKRAEAKTKLCAGDVVRVPPIQVVEKQSLESLQSSGTLNKAQLLKAAADIPILFEDDHLLVVNKPSGMAVHGGSGSSFGLIECIRALRAETHEDLELVHRIDRETSGILILSKKRSALRKLQEQLRARSWKKYYKTLVLGFWPETLRQVDLPLLKTQSGEKEARVFVDPSGDAACTKFKTIQAYKASYSNFTLIQAQILTGRTHQIRVHTSANKFPIAGDDRYGNFEMNKQLARHGLKRMFLHAARLQLIHPATNETIVIEAPLAPELDSFLKSLQAVNSR
ncbi:MAG: RluA family pseudouridine synthase [Limnobacter sp.]|uniref:RluA family pseudouridine synthase n=1 Tax=Limnobacter sp. TaxID=2003368 RepID=UPI0032EDCAEE